MPRYPTDGPYYVVDGVKYDRVTTALNIVRRVKLEHWRGELGNDEADAIRDAAADKGQRVHQLVAGLFSATGAVATSAEEAQMVLAFQQWQYEAVDEVIGVEQSFPHHGLMYCGTVDLVVRLKNASEPTIVDVKTGAHSPVFRLQTAAYAAAWCSAGAALNTKVPRLVLHLGKGSEAGRYETVRYDDPQCYEADFQAFASALRLYRWAQGVNLG